MSGATVRAATPADGAAIAAIYAPYVGDTPITFEVAAPDADAMAARISAISAGYPYLVAEAGGQVVGYAYATRYRERAAYDWVCETAIYVERGRARKGIGRLLYEALLDQLEERGFVSAIAVVTLPSRESVAFHQALGFEDRGRQLAIGYKGGRWHDIGIFQLDLAPRPARPQPPRGG